MARTAVRQLSLRLIRCPLRESAGRRARTGCSRSLGCRAQCRWQTRGSRRLRLPQRSRGSLAHLHAKLGQAWPHGRRTHRQRCPPRLASRSSGRFGGILWQRCQFHLQQNAQAYVPRADLKTEVAADIRAIFNAPDRKAAVALLAKTVAKYSQTASRLATWLEENIPQGLTVFSLPTAHRRRLRTTNGLERLNREIRRRSRVATLFPNEASCLRLVTAIVMKTSEEWLTDRTYLRLDAA